ncbi:NAD-dependent epimerase/dehydratase family protein [Psychromonas sp. 14N.309.X.WAT.B.A12]|uniref:2-alkyl-3-oxoalkanoate reductase n=1 Tax=Psychromonas sp. 14N.309.X.WAT.B.A12 TaxID=2998322 RepID=UPI0025B1F26A|nr:2-alkyl-3-oxoalkanoate reductase [Psychromonas sp. 14N.309.X.WAT.B.A12]MDN2662112.1 NAD-dependent epimerase/dehydratase family protein [Psychromonas sp. 14N.309.X.WAT.B.A12]
MQTPDLNFSDLLIEQQTVLKFLASQVKCVFVTGAGGFLGTALCRFLRAADIKVVGFARSDYPHLKELGVTVIKGDLQDKQAVINAMQGCDMVFHVASKAGVWGDKASYFKPNVVGTENAIAACHHHNIDKFIYTSTPSVTFAGEDEDYIDESQPYAKQFLNFYGLSKAVAEQKVLEANSGKLKTVALRPHLIWGPGDPHLVPRVIERAKAGKLKLVGKKDKLVDTTYIDNAVYAHLMAAVTLSEDNAACAGKAYFISNDQPILMAEMLNNILAVADLNKVTARVPSGLAYFVGTILEWWYLKTGKQDEPIMTRFVAKQLSTSHYFNLDAAKQDFNYQVLVSMDQGMKHLKHALQTKNDS